jgi:FkbM family methyltransferase
MSVRSTKSGFVGKAKATLTQPQLTPVYSNFRLLGKAVRMLVHKGPVFALRKAMWKVQHNRFERLRQGHRNNGEKLPSTASLLSEEFELHPSLRGLSEELLLFGIHEPVATSLYLRYLSPGDDILDIGSNIGYWLMVGHRGIGSSGKILGFEPVPELFDILKRNIERAQVKNAQVFPWAVGASNGTTQFYESEIPNWGSLIHDARLLPTRSRIVDIKRLDDTLPQFDGFCPSMLRMDVEGAELAVLEGARQLLRKYAPSLFIEFHPFSLGWEAVRKALFGLRELGYSPGTLIERTWDQPWISKWLRNGGFWNGTIDSLVQRIESPEDPLVNSTFTFALKSPRRKWPAS